MVIVKQWHQEGAVQ